MRTTRLIAVLVVVAAIAMATADASAYYHPTMGRFLSRDPGPGGANRIGGGGQAVSGGFIPRDPTGSNQYADGMNVYEYVRSQPVSLADPTGLWTRDGVLIYLCRTDRGRIVVNSIAQSTVKVLMSERVTTRVRKRANERTAWDQWEDREWGAMTEQGRNGTAVHLPKRYSDSDAALILAHESVHTVQPAAVPKEVGEFYAYREETLLALETPGMSPGRFVKQVKGGGQVIDEAAIRKFVKGTYEGWYSGAALIQYEKDQQGRIRINYGTETRVTGWKCSCPKEFYYYDYGYPPEKVIPPHV